MVLDYICQMAIEPKHIPALERMNIDELEKVRDYINDPMTATTIGGSSKPSRQIITSELVYAWMFQFRIPKECEKWHLNRLLMTIGVMGELQQKPKKGNAAKTSAKWAELNRQRLAQSGQKG
jgi:hypothetical protein